ncbi:hypothetical protein [Nitrososphaeria virus YSH_922147]|uniref:Uncharacterized protein n=1 Tax=Nitrososphaeria virus YSH_922147 TaxID=3071323 RepID=A0A976UAT3_9CAUD|nr:hypothetical protein QKV94_gp64 [Yangshan Harbor Nitrososphaeria virus]UVF62473.1 hypothetical protein [Nitrososphaeria virus YSH_922147]
MNSCGTKCGGKPHNNRYKPKVILEEKGDIYIQEEEYPSFQSFQVVTESGETFRGVFYSEDKSSYVYLNRHENIADIISTCNHEALHASIWQIIEWEFDEMWNDNLTEKWSIKGNNNRKEHNAIRVMLMPEEYFGE